jgi:hypothetical protein
MHQQLWGYKGEEKLYLGVRKQKRLITTALDYRCHLFRAIIRPTQNCENQTLYI